MTLMMLALLAFIAVGFSQQRRDLRTHLFVGAIAVGLASAYWITGRI